MPAIQGGVLGRDVKDVSAFGCNPINTWYRNFGWGKYTSYKEEYNNTNQVLSSVCTAADSQTSVEINVLCKVNVRWLLIKSLGRFILDGIPPSPRGT